MATQQYDVLDIDELDYGGLVRELSAEGRLPCSAHIRNTLLAPFCAAVPHPSLREDGASIASNSTPWQIYKDYRRGVQFAAIGDVPDRARRRPGGKQRKGDETEALWALVIICPVYAPGWVPRQDDPENVWSGARLYIWLSTERSLDLRATAASSGTEVLSSVHEATPEEKNLVRFIVERHLPAATPRYIKSQNALQQHGQPSCLPAKDDSGKQMILDLFAVNHAWVKVLEQLQDEADTPSSLRVRRVNPCLTNSLSAEEALKLTDETRPSEKWHIGPIEERDADMAMVQAANSIPFPLWYVKLRRHISVMISDGELGENCSYPSAIATGNAAGWGYAHDDLAFASLHVTEPYRRLKSASAKSNGVEDGSSDGPSVGLMCVAALARQLVEAQRKALQLSGVEQVEQPGADAKSLLGCPLYGDTELDKGPARKFIAKLGFHPASVSTWGAISIDVKDQ